MKIPKTKLILNLLVTVFLTFGLSISLQSVVASWDAPSETPPNCTSGAGCEVLVNTGSDWQEKNGPFAILGSPSAEGFHFKVNGIAYIEEICDETGAECKDISSGWANGEYVQKSGDIMTGILTLPELRASSSVQIDFDGFNDGAIWGDSALKFGGGTTGEGIASKRSDGGNRWGLDFYTGNQPRLSVSNAGNVGIGTTTPDSKLQVAGDIRVGLITEDDGLTAGYGNYLRFSGGDDWDSWPGMNSDNSDPLWIARHNNASDQSELRINIGDAGDSNDSAVFGYTSAIWYPLMSIHSDGEVEVHEGPIKATGGLIIETCTAGGTDCPDDGASIPANGQIWLEI